MIAPFFDIDLLPLLVVMAAFLIFPLQLFLCRKVKNRMVRLLPVILLTMTEGVLVALSCTSKGWQSLGYLFFVLVAAMMLLLCGLSWGLWAILRKRRDP